MLEFTLVLLQDASESGQAPPSFASPPHPLRDSHLEAPPTQEVFADEAASVLHSMLADELL